MVLPSASADSAVRPTVAAAAAFSATVLVAESESVGAVASNSSTSVTVIAKVVSEVLVSVLVARMTTLHEVALSALRLVLSATVTMPVPEATANTLAQVCDCMP